MGEAFELVGHSENPDRGRSVRDRLGRGEERASEEQPTRTDHWWVWDLEDVCDDDRELESLRSLMWRFTVKELKEGLDVYGVSKASARGKKKAGLVDLVMDEVMPRCLEDFMAVALPYGSDFIGDLRDLVRSGGRRVLDKHDVLYGVSMPVRAFPTTMLFDLSYEFVERVPQEALDLMSPLTDEA